MKVSVFIGTSLDGFIARADGGIDWLEPDSGDPGNEPNSGNAGAEDLGFKVFMDSVDHLVMGRNTFTKVVSFGQWPYEVPVTVLSSSLVDADIPENLRDRVTLCGKKPQAVVDDFAAQGAKHLYLDGGKTIQSYLRLGLIDEMIITRLPILIGEGLPLFGALDGDVRLEHLGTQSFSNSRVQSKYRVIQD